MTHLLNIRALGDEDIEEYALYRFNGREAISESFLYEIELLTDGDPDCSKLIGKLCEFDITQGGAEPRIFAGRIYAARKFRIDGGVRVNVQIRPAYHALSYAKDTHFVQDKSSIDIFEAMTKDLTGFVKSVEASTPKPRGYSVRLDEYEDQFLDRLLSHDGLMYFFVYDRGGGAFRHKMIVTDKTSSYIDVPGGKVDFLPHSDKSAIKHLERTHKATAGSHDLAKFSSMNSEKVDKDSKPVPDFANVYAHEIKTFAAQESDHASLAKALKEHQAQQSDFVQGRSDDAQLFAGGRVEITDAGSLSPARVVLIAVSHSAEDPWMFSADRPGNYSNSFTALAADEIYRPPPESPPRIAPGPFLGVVGKEGTPKGGPDVDDKYRVPVMIDGARDYSKEGLNKEVWLPVRQQWGAGSSHGSQFMPRAGTRVVINFINGNPDLPYIDGVLFSPENSFPNAHADTGTRTGWRSVTEDDGGVTQEFFFEDKDGKERVWLSSDRNYERSIGVDEIGTIGNDQTITIGNNQELTVGKDRTVDIGENQTTTVGKDRTTTVAMTSLHESDKEIILKVGQSSITIDQQGIVIKAPTIKIDADMTLDMSAGLSTTLKAVTGDINMSAMLTLKGGVVMIN